KKEDCPFIKHLNKAFYDIFDNVKEIEKVRKIPIGNYLWNVSDRVREINQNLEDIELTRKLLMENFPISYQLDRSKNDSALIRYHYENFILRVGKVKDLILLL